MLSRTDYLPNDIVSEEDNEINVFEEIYGSDEETEVPVVSVIYETLSEESVSLITEKLDTIIEYESNIHYAIWTLIAVVSFIVVVRLLWTIFDKWFFGGV